jgi:hypothetical protein
MTGTAVERIETYPLGDYFQHRLVLPGNHVLQSRCVI